MVTAYVRIERIIDSRERILAQGGVDRNFTNFEALARRGDRDSKELVQQRFKNES